MKAVMHLIAAAALASASTVANAQFVKGNEAVSSGAVGAKHVEIAPMPTAGSVRDRKPCRADGHCWVGPWLMIETSDGLVECTEVYARPGTCRQSTYGTKKLSRVWVVKSKGKWLQCQYPDLGSKCVEVFAHPPANLPYDAVQ